MRLLLALWLLLAPVFAQGSAPVPVLFASQPYVLDQLSSYPVVAFSVRQLTVGQYNPPYDWLVRRSSDNTQTQIGFVNGLLNTTALASFCAGTNCYLVTWKDAGYLSSSADATQSTAASQPQVVASGVVETQNGMPTVYFGGSQYLVISAVIGPTGASPGTLNIVAQVSSFVTTSTAFSYGANAVNNIRSLGQYTSANTLSYNYGGQSPSGSAATSALFIATGTYTGSFIQFYFNGSPLFNQTKALTTGTAALSYIGAYLGPNSYWEGSISEAISFANALSSSDQYTLEPNQGSTFKISGVTQ